MTRLDSPEDMQTSKSRGPRGSTCLNCRRRRIKCDGAQPTCNNCCRGGSQFDDCEYPTPGSASQVSILEDRIAAVRDKIQSLENPGGDPFERVGLIDPYQMDTRQEGPESSTSSNSSASDQTSCLSDRRDSFLRVSQTDPNLFGCFMSVEQLRPPSMLDTLLDDKRSDLIPALKTAMALWHSRLSHPDTDLESKYLQQILDESSNNISATSRCHILQAVQVELLLGYFFLYDGKLVTASHHADAASSLALAAGLNRSETTMRASEVLEHEASGRLLEDIGAFRSVTIFSNLCAALTGVHSSIHRPPLPKSRNGSPNSSKSGSPESENIHGRTIECDMDRSEIAAYLKATSVLEQVSTVRKEQGMPYPLAWSEVVRLNSTLDTLTHKALSEQPTRLNIATRMLLFTSRLRLHLPYLADVEQSRNVCMTTSVSISETTIQFLTQICENQLVDPAISIAWSTACKFLISEIASGRITGNAHHDAVKLFESIYETWIRLSSINRLLGKRGHPYPSPDESWIMSAYMLAECNPNCA